MQEKVEARFREVMPGEGFCSLRYVEETAEGISVRQGVPEPVGRSRDSGAMVTVVRDGGAGYAATSDLTAAGLAGAVAEASEWASRTAGRSVVDFDAIDWPSSVLDYAGPERVPWASTSLEAKFDLLGAQCDRLKSDDRIVDWSASLHHTGVETLIVNSAGARIRQRFSFVVPMLRATANEKAETQTRSFGGFCSCRQGGLEVLDDLGFAAAAGPIGAEAAELLSAPNCPTGTMDLLLDAGQMVLQIHESIGHPLELDRILGDERNYAGTSFVTAEMLGRYRYGSDLLNVTYDPTRPEQFASFACDDDGLLAEKTYLIEEGILQRALGGLTSQRRAGLEGVANARASGWNRPPIDRMANLNVECGEATLASMIASIERGVYMKTNRSWSIDDSRNKFQFGCEWARLIEDGKLTTVVKNPNYRGISAVFWRSLKAVGDPSTAAVLGCPNCGKGEPNQGVYVGHASPACVFGDVDVFGGE